MGETLEFENGHEGYSGYLATSKSRKGPGIVVIQEYWGLVDHIKRVADRFAEAGYTALAPDFYQGKTAKEPDEASHLMQALNIAQTERILHSAITALLSHPATVGDRVGVVGFCMGGQLALFAACVDDRIAGCIDYYGIHPKVKPDLENLHAPVLGFFAEHDEHVPQGAVQQLDDDLTRLNKPHEFITYKGVHHAFFNDDRPTVYGKIAAEDSWEKAMGFFHAHLPNE